eukprot:scaffold1182_cov165-Amphora_coffeaeformis.AAC.2
MFSLLHMTRKSRVLLWNAGYYITWQGKKTGGGRSFRLRESLENTMGRPDEPLNCVVRESLHRLGSRNAKVCTVLHHFRAKATKTSTLGGQRLFEHMGSVVASIAHH